MYNFFKTISPECKEFPIEKDLGNEKFLLNSEKLRYFPNKEVFEYGIH
jgi:hypothetical protein